MGDALIRKRDYGGSYQPPSGRRFHGQSSKNQMLSITCVLEIQLPIRVRLGARSERVID